MVTSLTNGLGPGKCFLSESHGQYGPISFAIFWRAALPLAHNLQPHRVDRPFSDAGINPDTAALAVPMIQVTGYRRDSTGININLNVSLWELQLVMLGFV